MEMEKQVFSIGTFANEVLEIYASDSSWLGSIFQTIFNSLRSVHSIFRIKQLLQ